MNKSYRILIAILGISCFTSSLMAFGAPIGMAPYNKATFTTVNATVKSIDTVYNKHMKEDGLHLKITSSAQKSYIIHVCPQWYADKEKIIFTKGEQVTVLGSQFVKDNEDNIYAASIIRETGTLSLRNRDTGKNLWKGRESASQKKKEEMQGKEGGMQRGGGQGQGRGRGQ